MQLFSVLNLPIVEVAAASAVLLSTFLVALNTLDLSPEAFVAIQDGIIALNLIFAFDFFIRWYAAGQFKLIYLTKPLVIVDIIVVILPLFLGTVMPMVEDMVALGDAQEILALNIQDSPGLQVLLLLRVLRLRRVLTDINTFSRFAVALGIKSSDVRPYQLQLARVLLSIFTLLSVASGLIYTAEHNVNPDIPDYFTALYFGLTTLTTVGFGDITPITFQGRLIVCGSILAGIAVIPAQAATLVEAIVESQTDIDRLKQQLPAQFTPSEMVSKELSSSATDGMGPSGKPIDIPVKEKSVVEVETSISRVCTQCGATEHRADASYCWSCGFDIF
jgi:voltage-gated potassium channel Kch